MTDEIAALKAQVQLFKLCALPGQAKMMHMGTSYLMDDLLKKVEELQGIVEDQNKYLCDQTPFQSDDFTRGEDSGFIGAISSLRDIIEGGELHGVSREPWQTMRVQIHRLVQKSKVLDALEDAGVDNWSGYDEAMEMLDGDGCS